ncbi:DUF4189 domain-containing protein [Altererythrobacter sp. BO-6]|uniref:DUF4189 domain-containing protein n=1 Tax=Altererythrobacter sp. BO-6 TaxID=2604537 RepID=UPI0013E155E5|nr:DUF4189 domain-containing protein [Altererythrobacter sp. BO-6]QIG55074.1 DUF4189 domain-containing protein [Altererythrobacter sp. BO-6]
MARALSIRLIVVSLAFLAALMAATIGLVAPEEAKASYVCDNVQVGQMPNGGRVMQNQCYWVYGAAAIDPVTRNTSASWNQPTPEAAANDVLSRCGSQCVYISFGEDFAWIALSDDNQSYGISTSGPRDAELRCEAMRGSRCYTVVAASSTANGKVWSFGSIAYDPDTGKRGAAWSASRWSDAQQIALSQCGTANCWAYTYQSGFGGMAKAKAGELFGNWSDKSQSDAGKKALKECEKKHGKKNCSVVHTGSANRPPKFKG